MKTPPGTTARIAQRTSASRWVRFIRWSFNQFYTRFAFTYDAVSQVVSRGEWRAWTRAAIPYLKGTQILEVAFGTGNLHLDLYAAGFQPTGLDLSPNMHAITRRKFRAKKRSVPRLVRASVVHLPFADAQFSSLVMTFPPGFVYDLNAMRELWRVLQADGRILWVDAPELHADSAWGRFLNWAFAVTGGCASPGAVEVSALLEKTHGGALGRMWNWKAERVQLQHSQVHVFVGTKQG